jgi:hypothetical protein
MQCLNTQVKERPQPLEELVQELEAQELEVEKQGEEQAKASP